MASHKEKTPPVPVGIDCLLGLAAASSDYARELFRRREATLEASQACGVALNPTEQTILATIDDQRLEQMIQGVERDLSDAHRRVFLQHAALALAALVAGVALAGPTGCRQKGQPANEQSHPAVAAAERVRKDDLPLPMDAPLHRSDIQRTFDPFLDEFHEVQPGEPPRVSVQHRKELQELVRVFGENDLQLTGGTGIRPERAEQKRKRLKQRLRKFTGGEGRVYGGCTGIRPGREGIGYGRHPLDDLPVLKPAPRPVVSNKPPRILAGDYSDEVVARILRRKRSTLVHCYRQALQADAEATGTATVRLTLTRLGRVGRLELSSTLKSAAADKCLRRAIQGWRFPKPTGRMPLVAFTLSFKLMT